MPDPTQKPTLNVLLIGGGGREHALAQAITRSPRLGTLYTTHPQNPGLAAIARPVDVPVSAREIYRLEQFCDKHDIGLVVIGPEDPLAEGFADKLAKPGRLVFGPTKRAAMIESDKAYAKEIMRAASIPTGEAWVFTDADQAEEFLRTRDEAPVVKAAGLAKGKGVVVPASIDEAIEAVDQIMRRRVHGDAGAKVLLEEKLSGREVSVLALVDGRNILMLPTAQDHKRLLAGDRGPNTGGMGVFTPAPDIDQKIMDRIECEVLVPLVDTLRRDDIEYRGVLYAGLMLTHAGPKVLEFNARFGDPECQPIMAKLETDAIDLLEATAAGRLDEIEVSFSDEAAVCVVLAAEGYPEKPRSGDEIHGLDVAAEMPGVTISFAGVAENNAGKPVTAGGRVLGVTATGKDLAEARERAYEAADAIRFRGMQRRDDIASSAG